MINHLLLTLEHASCKGVKVLGYVLNRVTAERSLAMETNREVMSGLTGVSCLGDFPFVDGAETQTFPLELFEAEFDVSNIQRLLP
jgi:dethiobiotin synthetase